MAACLRYASNTLSLPLPPSTQHAKHAAHAKHASMPRPSRPNSHMFATNAATQEPGAAGQLSGAAASSACGASRLGRPSRQASMLRAGGAGGGVCGGVYVGGSGTSLLQQENATSQLAP